MIKLLFFINMVFAQEYYCVMQSGDTGKLKFKGPDVNTAMYKTSKACLQLRIQQYMTIKLSEPSTERRILFMEDCVNNTFCKKIEKESNEN